MSRFIRLRGLPWSVTHKEILDFLKNVSVVNGPKGILMVTSRWDGKNTGEAFVELENEKDEQEAFKQNRAVLGHRYIEIFSASNEEVQCAMKKPGSAFSTVVKLRGLPYAVTEEQIEKFFHGLDIKPDREGILIVMDRRGRATGEAYVQFETQDDTEKALGRNREKIGHRYIEIFRSSTAELRRQLLGNRVGPYDLKERGACRNRNDIDIARNITRARDSRDMYNTGFGFHNNNNQLDYNSGKSLLETGFGFRNDFPFMTSNNNNSFGNGNTNFGQKNICGFQENTFPFASSDFFNMSNSDVTNLSKAMGFSNSNLNYGAADNNSNRNYIGFTNEFSLFKNFRTNRKTSNTDNFCRENSAINSTYGDNCFNTTNADNVENTANNDVFGVTGKTKHQPDGRFGSNDGRRQDDFFCVHMRGLPYNSFENDVFKFFDPIRPANVKIVFNNKGLHSGTADAIFETYEDAQLAMKRHMEQIGSRYIELFFDGKAKLNGYSRRI